MVKKRRVSKKFIPQASIVSDELYLPNHDGIEDFSRTKVTNWFTENLKVDHIAEKTVGHNIVIDNDIELNRNTIKFTGVSTPTIKNIASLIDIFTIDSGTGANLKLIGSDASDNIGSITLNSAAISSPDSLDLGDITNKWKDLFLSGNAIIETDLNVDGDTTLDKLTAIGDTGLIGEVGDNQTITGGAGYVGAPGAGSPIKTGKDGGDTLINGGLGGNSRDNFGADGGKCYNYSRKWWK